MLEQEATGVPDSTVPIWLSIHYPPNMAKAARPFPFPAPFNYLAPSKPLVAPSNVLPQSKVGFSLHLRPPTSRSWSLPIPRGLTADDPPPGHATVGVARFPPRTRTVVFPATLPHGPPPPIPGWSRPPGGPGSVSCGGYGTGARCVPGVSGSPLDLVAAVLLQAPGAPRHHQPQPRPQPLGSAAAGE